MIDQYRKHLVENCVSEQKRKVVKTLGWSFVYERASGNLGSPMTAGA